MYVDSLDDVRIYDIVLTDDEINEIFQEGAPVCTPPPSGMVSWWPLDETTGIMSGDIQGVNDGAHQNSPTPVSGIVEGALNFDGTDQHVNIPEMTFGPEISIFSFSDLI